MIYLKKLFYKRWWFWLIIAIITGGIVSAVESSKKDDESIVAATAISTGSIMTTEAVTIGEKGNDSDQSVLQRFISTPHPVF